MALVPGGAVTAPMSVVVLDVVGSRQRVRLPTGTAAGRAFMQGLCINDEEVAMAALPSHNVIVLVSQSTDLCLFVAKIVRREGYFWTLLVQSRGAVHATACAQRCGGGLGAVPFKDCRMLPGYQRGACGSCIWQSHGSRCQHCT
ncbi:hypothetical protein EJ04DRAFT_530272 [Polyplosphaeria fusca]|uniref:Uncharacterized protein n=1 Tax=Polyplosphaeria fusca TaxID=682080 RepID=A0A9P4QHA4_9PLEO|nr:hypothetical protein EJ04DRAFT_530272 [Polyplosphaeria fusca]